MSESIKLTCNVTKVWQYQTPEQIAVRAKNHGGEENLFATYVSRRGQKARNECAVRLFPEVSGEETTYHMLSEEQKHHVDQEINIMVENGDFVPKNMVRDYVTGELLICSEDRMAKLIAKMREEGHPNADEDFVRRNYTGRVTRRRMADWAKICLNKEDAKWTDLTPDQQEEGIQHIRTDFESGNWERPAAPKGSKANGQQKTIVHHTSESSHADTTPESMGWAELDPYRHIDGESAKDRKNRIRREKRRLAKAST